MTSHSKLFVKVLRATAGTVAACLLAAGSAKADEDKLSLAFESTGAAISESVASSFVDANVVINVDAVSRNQIVRSGNENQGLVLINQNSGNVNNQANVVTLALARFDGSAVSDLSAYTAHRISDNVVTVFGGTRTNQIVDSFNGTNGVVAVNQSAGNLNSQVNVIKIGFGVSVIGSSAKSVSDTALGAVVSGNTDTRDGKTIKSDTITGSFKGFSGVAAVTQSSGDGNAISNVTSIGITVVGIK